MKFFRVVLSGDFKRLDDSLYLEKRVDALGRECWFQVEDYSSIGKKVYITRIRKCVALSGIEKGRWEEVKNDNYNMDN